jgi:hypothetical protein
MFEKILSILPHGLGAVGTAAALGAAGVGALLWLAGARFSRSLMALTGVAAGTFAGMHLPGWLGWGVDGMGVAVVGAMIVGVAGYLFHTTALGAVLGSMLGLGSCLAAWALLADGATWAFPAVDWSASAESILSIVWRSLPGNLPRVMPVVLAGGLTAGVILTVLWPRAARALTYSMLGAMVMTAAALLAVRSSHPQWLAAMPSQPEIQLLFLALLVAVGAALQWSLLPRASVPGVKPGAEPPAAKTKPARPKSPVTVMSPATMRSSLTPAEVGA